MFHMQKPGRLKIPKAEHCEIDGRHYSIAPLIGSFAIFHARSYAERIAAIMAADGTHSRWARELQPEITPRAKQFKAAYNTKNDKQIDTLGTHISRKASTAGAYVLAVGIFDNQTAEPRNPASMIGYIETSLQTGYKNEILDTYSRVARPHSVRPSIGHGVLLYPELALNEERLTDWAVRYAIRTFRPEEIGVRYADSLDFETCLESVQDTSWIEPYGDYEIMPSNRVSVLGETPTTVRFASLANIVKTT